MKKVLLVAFSLTLFTQLVGCSSSSAKLKDGEYTAEHAEFDDQGWKPIANVKVADGKIAEVSFDAINQEGGINKKELSIAGGYDMKTAGAQSDWHEQIKLAEDELVKTQDPAKLSYTDQDGHTDAISGCTITVKEYYTVAQQAIDQAK